LAWLPGSVKFAAVIRHSVLRLLRSHSKTGCPIYRQMSNKTYMNIMVTRIVVNTLKRRRRTSALIRSPSKPTLRQDTEKRQEVT
jgi:hypothetical protein